MTAFAEGMRVVVADGPWPLPRIAGTYGKVTDIDHHNGQEFIRIRCTGHVDGQPALDLARLDIFPFYPHELTVVD